MAETNIRQTLIRVSTVRLVPLLPRHKTTEQSRTRVRKVGHQRSKSQQERNIRKPRTHSQRAQRRTQHIRTRIAQKHVLTRAHIPRQERRKSTGNSHTSQRQPRQVHHPTGQRIRQTSYQTVSTRNTVNAVHKVRHINVAGNKNRAQNQQQNVRALHRRKAHAHQHTNHQLQARTTHNAHAANILQPAQGESAQNRRGNCHRQLQRLSRTVRPAEQGSRHKRYKGRGRSRQPHTAVGRSSMRRTLIRNIHHVVAVQNRAHRKRQKGTQDKSKSKNAQQLRKGGHTSSKALAPLPWTQAPESQLRDDVCVVCVFTSYSIELFSSPGLNVTDSLHTFCIFCVLKCSTPEKEKTPDTAPATQVQHPVSFP